MLSHLPALGNQLWLDFDAPPNVLVISTLPKPPPVRRIDRSRVGMLGAAATFAILTPAEQREFDQAGADHA